MHDRNIVHIYTDITTVQRILNILELIVTDANRTPAQYTGYMLSKSKHKRTFVGQWLLLILVYRRT